MNSIQADQVGNAQADVGAGLCTFDIAIRRDAVVTQLDFAIHYT